jgi:hypothetical protein
VKTKRDVWSEISVLGFLAGATISGLLGHWEAGSFSFLGAIFVRVDDWARR